MLIQVEGDNPERIIVAAELAKDVMDRAGIEHFHNLGFAKGADLELSQFQHPFYDFTVPAILGDHVTTDSGTGVVHTAPGHGQEDFAVGQKYDLEVANPVGSNGVYLPDTELFAGQHVFKANDAVVETLKEKARYYITTLTSTATHTAGVIRLQSFSVQHLSGSFLWTRLVYVQKH